MGINEVKVRERYPLSTKLNLAKILDKKSTEEAGFSATDLVRDNYHRISALLDKGYSVADVAELFAGAGVVIGADTLKSTWSRVKRESGNKTGSKSETNREQTGNNTGSKRDASRKQAGSRTEATPGPVVGTTPASQPVQSHVENESDAGPTSNNFVNLNPEFDA